MHICTKANNYNLYCKKYTSTKITRINRGYVSLIPWFLEEIYNFYFNVIFK